MISKGLWGKKFLDVQERTYEIAPPDEDHVIVEVKACGVCGTDINFVRDWDDEPMALGHEISAEVLEVGKNVTTVKPGDTVIVEDVTHVRRLRGLQERAPRVLPQHVQHRRPARHGAVHVRPVQLARQVRGAGPRHRLASPSRWRSA